MEDFFYLKGGLLIAEFFFLKNHIFNFFLYFYWFGLTLSLLFIFHSNIFNFVFGSLKIFFTNWQNTFDFTFRTLLFTLLITTLVH